MAGEDPEDLPVRKLCEEKCGGSGSLNRAGRTEILADPVFDHVSGTKTPQGILAVVERRDYRMPDILGAEPAKAHVLVLDNLQDPGNLGTIFRTAEAAGVTGIILSSDCVDIYNPKVVRSTMGAVLRMPFLYVEDLPGAIGELKKEGSSSMPRISPVNVHMMRRIIQPAAHSSSGMRGTGCGTRWPHARTGGS